MSENVYYASRFNCLIISCVHLSHGTMTQQQIKYQHSLKLNCGGSKRVFIGTDLSVIFTTSYLN